MVRQLGRLDLGVDGSKVGRLSSDDATVLLLHAVAATEYNSLGALQFVHCDLIQLGKIHRSGKQNKRTYGEQGAGRATTTIADDRNLLGVKQRLGRWVERERLALLTQLLTEEILAIIDDFPDRVLEPVVALWKEGVVVKGPVEGVVQQLRVGIHTISDGGSDGFGERLSTSLGVETGLGFRSTLGPGDDTVEPMGDANVSTTIVGNIDDQLFRTSRPEVLQTREEVLLELIERGGTEAAKSQDAGLRFIQVVELGDRVASTQWWQGRYEFGREEDGGRGSGVEEDVKMVFTSLFRRDHGLLLNAGGALLDGGRNVVVDTICTLGGPAVISME